MAKYKKKKLSEPKEILERDAPSSQLPRDVTQAVNQSASATQNPSEKIDKRARKMASGSIQLQFAGDLVLVKSNHKLQTGLFKRYADLFEALANLDKDARNLIYRFLTCLVLTSHAKKAQKVEAKRNLFELKNNLFVSMANERTLRRNFEFKYLVSKNFRVISYCEECTHKNNLEKTDKHKWKYCKNCNVDHNFYNLLSMETKFPKGWARLFLSNDQIPRLKGFKLPRKIPVGEIQEEAFFDRYHYNSRNLDAINLDSIQLLFEKLSKQPLGSSAVDFQIENRQSSKRAVRPPSVKLQS